MIDQALIFLRDELNTYILARTNSTNVDVRLSKIATEAGKYAFPEKSIALTVLNLEEDRLLKDHLPEYNMVNGQQVRQEPELKLSLSIMFAANFKIYEEAWKAISLVLTYFQSHLSFTSAEYPALSPKIGKLTVNLELLNFEQLNQVWAFLGAKHLPSVTYRIRMIIIQDEVSSGIQQPITSIQTNIHTK